MGPRIHAASSVEPPSRLDRRAPPAGGVVTLSLLLLAGCFPDDWDGRPYRPDTGSGPGVVQTDDTGSAVTDDPGLPGAWRSEGGDLSELFSGDPFNYAWVEAEFGTDGDYVVTSADQGGAEYVLTGTYTVDEATTPGTVVLTQTEPYEATAEGIWQVDGDVLTYEVVQTDPDYGFAPPTPEAGFGSTAGPGLSSGANVQRYRRLP